MADAGKPTPPNLINSTQPKNRFLHSPLSILGYPDTRFPRPRSRARVTLQLMSYFRATSHPWPILILLLPLLSAYEGGVLWLGGPQPELIRNGADAWLRSALQAFGINQMVVAPALVGVGFAVWSWWR